LLSVLFGAIRASPCDLAECGQRVYQGSKAKS
jgi:hypothetical protein